MAKKDKLQLDDFNFDSELDFSDFNPGAIDKAANPEAKKPKSRKAVSDVFHGSIKGAKSTLTSPSFVGKVMRKSLPETYGEAADGVAEVSKGLASLYDEAAKEIKPQMRGIATKVDRLIPAEQKTLKKISTKFKKLVGADEDSNYRGPSREAAEDANIQAALGTIFAAQQDADDERMAQDRATGKIRDAVEGKRHTANFGLLTSMNANIERLTRYNDRVNQAYQKKSLELQYRSYFVQSEMLRTTREYFEVFKLQNEAITKNTGLPEYVKIKESERFKEMARKKLYEGAHEKLFGKDSAIGKGMKRIQTAGMNYIRGVAGGLQQMNMMLDGATMVNDQMKSAQSMMGDMGFDEDPTMNKEYMAGELLGEGAVNVAGHFGARHLKKLATKHPGIVKFGHKLASKFGNINATAQDFRNSKKFTDMKNGGGLKGMMAKGADWLLGNFRDQKADARLSRGINMSELDHPSANGITNRAIKSITDIIPGYLSRILREITVLRTGDDSLAVTGFDFKTGRFASNTKIKDGIMKRLKDGAKSTSLDFHLDRTKEQLFKGKKLSGKQSQNVKDFLSKLSTEHNVSMNESSITRTESFKNLDPATQKLVRQQLRKKLSKDETGAGQYELTKRMGQVRDSTTVPVGELSALIDAGYGEMMEEEGLLKMDENGGYSVDQEKYVAFLREHGIAKSDINAKRGISSFSPKKALDAVKKTPIFNWFYKKGKGDKAQHTGPMAQDVNKNMGFKAAPNGTTIDLTTMNGVNMAAIQAMDDKLKDSTAGSKGGRSILEGIKSDTARIIELIEAGGGIGTRPGKPGVEVEKEPTESKGRFFKGDGSYKDTAKQLMSSGIDLVSKISSDVFGAGQKAFTFGKDKVVVPGAQVLKKAYDDNKDKIKETIGNVFEKVQGLAGSAFDMGKDFLQNKVPSGWKMAVEAGKKGVKKFNELLHGTKDIYVKGMNQPALRANLMQLGEYFDKTTGEVIKSFKDIKGPVVDKLGNVVLGESDMERGLVGVDGKPLGQLLKKLGKFTLGALGTGLGKAGDFLSSMLNGAAPLVEKMMGGLKDVLKNGLTIGFGGQRVYDVLCEIRSILKGENPEPHEKAKTSQKSDDFVGPSKPTMLNRAASKIKSAGQTAKSAIHKAIKAPDADFIGPLPKSQGIVGKAKSTAGGLISQAKGFLKGRKQHQEEFVGPIPQSKASRAVSKMKGLFAGGNIIPESLVPMAGHGEKKSIMGRVSGLFGGFGRSTEEHDEHQDEDEKNKKSSWNDKDGSGHRDGDASDRQKALDKRAEERKAKGQLAADLTAKYKSDKNVIDVMMDKAKGLMGGLFGGDGDGVGLEDAADLLPDGKNAGKRGFFDRMKRARRLKKLKAVRAGRNAPGLVGKTLKLGGNLLKGGGRLLGGMGKAAAKGFQVTGKGAQLVGKTGALGKLGRFGLGTAKMLGKGGLKLLGGMGKAAGKGFSIAGKAASFLPSVLSGGGKALGALAKGGGALLKGLPLLSAILGTHDGMKDLMADPHQKNGTFNSAFDFLNPFKYGAFAGKYLNKGINGTLSAITGKETSLGSSLYDMQEKMAGLFGFKKKVDPTGQPSLEEINALHKKTDGIQFKSMDEYNQWLAKRRTENQEKAKKEAEEKAKQPQGQTPTVPAPPSTPAVINTTPQGQQPQGQGEDGAGAKDGPLTTNNGLGGATPNGAGGLKEADGPIRNGSAASQFIKLLPGVDLNGIRQPFMQNFNGMVQEYGEKTGKSITVTSGYRSSAKQAELYRKDPSKASPPGNSTHELGLSMDVNSPDLDALDKLGLMRKYGFTRPVGGETWHMEAAGMQGNIAKAKSDLNFADKTIASSLGKGGAGIGSIKGSKLNTRDPQGAIALWTGSAQAPTASATSDKDAAAAMLAGNKAPEAPKASTASTPATASTDPSKPATTVVAASTGAATADGEDPAFGKPVKPTSAGFAADFAKETAGGTKDPSKGSIAQAATYSKTTPTSPESQATSAPGGVQCDPNDIRGTIATCAKKAGGDPNLMTAFAAVESGFNPNAKASTSSATGLFQFTNATWDEQLSKHGRKYGLDPNISPTDVTASSLLATEMAKSNAKAISSVKSNPNLTDIYLAHFLGAGGARKFLRSDPNAIGADIMPDAAKANRAIFYDKSGTPRTIGAIYSEISGRLSRTAAAHGIQIPVASLNESGSTSTTTSNSTTTTTTSSASTPKTTSGSSSGSSSSASIPGTYGAAKAASGGVIAPPPASTVLSSGSSGGRSESSGSGLGQVADVMTKSYDVQVKTYDVLRQILSTLTAGASGGNAPTQPSAPPAKAIPISADAGTFKMPESAVDLRRRA